MNQVALYGNLTRDPELKYGQTGNAWGTFTIAVNEVWKGKDGEKKQETSFINCKAFGKTMEIIAQWFKKGQPILISGKLKQDQWEDAQTGEKRTAVYVLVEEITFLQRAKDGPDSPAAARPAAKSPSRRHVAQEDVPSNGPDNDDPNDDDVPF